MKIAYLPLTPHLRTKRSRLHFSSGGAYTECGLLCDSLDGTCLGEMELDEAMGQQDTCKRCIHSMRSNDHT